LLLFLLANFGVTQLIDLPPDFGFGTAEVTGTLSMFATDLEETTMDATGRFTFDVGSTHISLKLVGGQSIQTWFRHHPTPLAKSREAWLESVDSHLPEYDECRTIHFPQETYICQDWLNYGEVTVRGEKFIQWSRSCGFRQEPDQFRLRDFMSHVFRIHVHETSEDGGAHGDAYACPLMQAALREEKRKEEEKEHAASHRPEDSTEPVTEQEKKQHKETEREAHHHHEHHPGKYLGSFRYDIWVTLDGKISTISANWADMTGVIANLVIHPAEIVKTKPEASVFTPCVLKIMAHRRHHEL